MVHLPRWVTLVAWLMIAVGGCRSTARLPVPPAVPGELRGRALVAVPRGDGRVFLSWRTLVQDGPSAYRLLRSERAEGSFREVAVVPGASAHVDRPGPGTFHYRVEALTGDLAGMASQGARVDAGAPARDWVTLFSHVPTTFRIGNQHFADTDGDGEMEFVSTLVKDGTYHVAVVDLFSETGPRWSWDTRIPGSAAERAWHDYGRQGGPIAVDLDADGKDEIVTIGYPDGVLSLIVLADRGSSAQVLGVQPAAAFGIAPEKKFDGANEILFAFGRFSGERESLVVFKGMRQGKSFNSVDVLDWNGRTFVRRWRIDGATMGQRGSHSPQVFDFDGDGRDELLHGGVVVDHDGHILWTTKQTMGETSDVGLVNILDIDPRNPGLEVLMAFELPSRRYGLLDARTGRPLWMRDAAERDVQVTYAANITGQRQGFDVIGISGGHFPTRNHAHRFDGQPITWPLAEPTGNMYCSLNLAIDWDGDRGRNPTLDGRKVYGPGTNNVLFQVNFADAPNVPANDNGGEDFHPTYWGGVDAVGDHREELVMRFDDGTVRAYLNTTAPLHRRVTPWQHRAYRLFQGITTRRCFAAPLGQPQR